MRLRRRKQREYKIIVAGRNAALDLAQHHARMPVFAQNLVDILGVAQVGLIEKEVICDA